MRVRCPVDCIHYEEGVDRKLFIDPNECIDCGACEPECPVNAIFPEESLPVEWAQYTAIDATWYTCGRPRGPTSTRSSRLTPGASPIRAQLAALAAAVAVTVLTIGCAPAAVVGGGQSEAVRRFRVTSSLRPLTAADLTSLAQDAPLALEAAGIAQPRATATNDGLEISWVGGRAGRRHPQRAVARGRLHAVLRSGSTDDGTPVDSRGRC